MELTTRSCHQHGHPEFVLEVGDAPMIDGQWLVAYLEQAVAAGERFRAGETVQIGWMIARVEPASGGHLTLCEPDLRVMPVRFVPRSTATLRHLRAQRDVADSVGLTVRMCFPSVVDSTLVCTVYDRGPEWVLARAEPDGNDSGWFIGCTADDHDHDDPGSLLRVSLYEAALKVPEAIEYLALPATTLVVVARGGEPEISWEGAVLRVMPGSYLARRATGAASRG